MAKEKPKEIEVSISSHAHDRRYNDKAEHIDMVIFTRKLVKLYDLPSINVSSGFYKFTDGDITAIVKKEDKHDSGVQYNLITLYNKHDSYLVLNINVRDFICMYEGPNDNDRLHKRISKTH